MISRTNCSNFFQDAEGHFLITSDSFSKFEISYAAKMAEKFVIELSKSKKPTSDFSRFGLDADLKPTLSENFNPEFVQKPALGLLYARIEQD